MMESLQTENGNLKKGVGSGHKGRHKKCNRFVQAREFFNVVAQLPRPRLFALDELRCRRLMV